MTHVICNECETVQHCMKNGCIPKINTFKEKPVVYYIGVPQLYDWNDDERYPVARLQYVLDHPKLGNCRNVRTSTVLNLYFDGTIETKNTIYKPMASEGMGS
jgi:hypothetical protein